MIGLLGSVAGLIGGVVLWLQFALGVRPIARLFTHDYARVLRWHRWLGTYGVLFVFIHPLLEMLAFGATWSFVFVPSFASEYAKHVTFGQFALYGVLVLWLLSAVVRGKITYRPWKYIHYISYPAMFFVFLHAREIGSLLLSYPLLSYLWSVLMFSYFAMVAWRIADALRLTRARYALSYREEVTRGIHTYTLTPTGKSRLSPRVGQYAYLSLRPFGESHPFTIMDYNKDTGALLFGIKSFGPFTDTLGTVAPNARVYVDGPYGDFTKEGHNGEPKVLIAGGIGVTPFIDLVQEYGNDATYLLNCNTTVENAVHRDTLKGILGERYVDVVEPERLSPQLLARVLPASYFSTARFFICGPLGLMRVAAQQLKELGVPEDRIFTEEFSF